MNPKDIKLFVATPMYGGVCYHSYTSGLVDLGIAAERIEIGFRARFVLNNPLVTVARNSLVSEFLDTGDTHFMFIDADVGFNPNDVLSMIRQDVDVIAGVYPKKLINWEMVKHAATNGVSAQDLCYHTSFHTFRHIDGEPHVVDLNLIKEVDYAATGFMLIKRKVFENLADKVDEYRFIGNDKTIKIKNFFYTKVFDNELYGEDVSFCHLLRQHGMKVYIAPWVQLSHIGTHKFEGRLI
jgi:hypothetical protein